MPRTESNKIELGAPAPEFVLHDASGRMYSLGDFDAAPALLVAFISNRCPFVLLIREELARFAREHADKGLAILAINSNDADAYAEETRARVVAEAADQGYGFPYLKDEDQVVARAFGAACTPDLFLYDANRRLAYHGQFDDARPGNGKPVTGADLRAAADAVLKGERPAGPQVPSIGCNIKWLPGSMPARLRAHAAA